MQINYLAEKLNRNNERIPRPAEAGLQGSSKEKRIVYRTKDYFRDESGAKYGEL